MPLETEATVELRDLIADLKPADADLLEALHRMQHRYGYISAQAMRIVGEQLNLSEAHVYGATTFYSELRTTPPPAHTIAWCSGASCLLKNSQGLLRAFEAVLDCPLGGATDDRSVELIRGQCNGTCEQAPQIWLDGEVVGRLTAAQVVRVARSLRDGDDAATALAGMDG
ncbi:MAG TPA: NAD(P)H-dependent oxidoreductase subunit E [Dehalococcoidia bacterium]|nr:NAD(P)H-dependent oxidoreductase subunit E [Dehalococcoidia bacterium]